MRLRQREMPPEDFAMTPMIDMVFLLLVFFMCVSSLSQANLNVAAELPDSATSRVPADLSDRVTVTVKADGGLFFGATPLDLPALKERLASAAKRQPRLQLHVRAEKGTPFGTVSRVLRAGAEAGLADVIYATHQER